jgi:hypothetical protein
MNMQTASNAFRHLAWLIVHLPSARDYRVVLPGGLGETGGAAVSTLRHTLGTPTDLDLVPQSDTYIQQDVWW